MKLAEMRAEPVVLVGADMMKFVDRDQAIVESLDAEFIDGETECRMGANQHAIFAARNSPTALTLDLAMRGSSIAGALQRFHRGFDLPIRPEAESATAARRRSCRRWSVPARR